MSPQSIATRLEALRALYIIGASLTLARRIGRVEDRKPDLAAACVSQLVPTAPRDTSPEPEAPSESNE